MSQVRQDRQRKYNVTVRRVRANIFAVEKQHVLHIPRVCSLSYSACYAQAPYCYLWPFWLYSVFPHYLINGKILEKVLLKKCVCFDFLCVLSETFLILRRTERDIIHVHRSSYKVPVILVRF